MVNAPARRTPSSHTLGCLVLLTAVLGSGCSSRFRTETGYVARGFTRGSLQGQTVAVVALPAAPGHPSTAPATAPAVARGPGPEVERLGAVAGVAVGIREAGARVQVVPPRESGAVFAAARRGAVDAAYLLLVWVTDADAYRTYAPRRGPDARTGLAAARTSGRRVALRLALLRLPDAHPVWLANGTGEAWETQTNLPAAGLASGEPAARTIDDDLRENGALYPPPPDPQALSRRLMRRLLAAVPWATEVEPN